VRWLRRLLRPEPTLHAVDARIMQAHVRAGRHLVEITELERREQALRAEAETIERRRSQRFGHRPQPT